ncbi:sensor histidine kinase [Dactylosporangium sp. NPDC051541]|uniref:sensor histidine kinase n=1 Tax=Dactylosporangium sp. NPDC051541 TaxID=3363977 RepID=UPI0037BD305F
MATVMAQRMQPDLRDRRQHRHPAQGSRIPDNLRTRLKTIARTGRHMQQLVNDLLDAARLDAGPLHFTPQPVALRDVLHDSAETLRHAADQQHLTLQADVGEQLLVSGDPLRLRQLTDNLLSNAIK